MLCSPWIDEADVAECCAALSDSGSAGSALMAQAAQMATEILYHLSGSRFGGVCTATVRPCSDPCRCGWGQVLASGHVVGFEDYTGRWWNEYGRSCGCGRLSRVKLAGYPVQDISEVKIDGIAITPSSADAEYRLDEKKYLTRLADPNTPNLLPRWWPGCQRLDVDDTQIGTFSITYTYGEDPPEAGVAAARELACQLSLAMACHDDCQLPQGVTQIVRQGVSFQRAQIDMFGKGRTGLVLVDAFLGSINPGGLRRPPSVWSPDVQRFARPV
jgi:hypothetical protein